MSELYLALTMKLSVIIIGKSTPYVSYSYLYNSLYCIDLKYLFPYPLVGYSLLRTVNMSFL